LRRSWGAFLLWILVLAFALTSGRALAFSLFYFVTGAILLALWWSWVNLRGLRVRRVARGQRTQVGRYFEESLELTNNSRWPKLWVEVLDFSDLPGHHVSRVVNSLRAHGSSHWQVRTLARQRGRFVLGPLMLTTGDPLGLFRFRRTLPATSPLVVCPATVDLPAFSPPSGYLAGGEILHVRTPYVTTSVSGVRDYEPGDSLNRVHWPSTARTGRLISKEFELDPLADVWIFLDMHEDAQAESEAELPEWSNEAMPWLHRGDSRLQLAPSTVEYGCTIAASLAQYFIRLDRSVGFLCYAGTREVVQPDRGERQLDRLLEILAVIQGEGRIPLHQVLASEGTRLARHTTLVAITSSTDPAWVAGMRGLRARGVQGLTVFMAARTFGPAGDWQPTLAELQATGLPAYLVRRGDDLAAVLSSPGNAERPGAGR
jgi:uncharacterized protein (DUF58 family)